MQAISLLVARYGALVGRTNAARETVAKAIFDATSVRLEPREIEIGEGEIRIRVSGSRRAALFIKKETATAAAAATPPTRRIEGPRRQMAPSPPRNGNPVLVVE